MRENWAIWKEKGLKEVLRWNGLWHKTHWVSVVCFFVACNLELSQNIIILYGAIFYITFEATINKIGLRKPFFYVGTTSEIDQFYQLFGNPSLTNAIVKTVMLAVAILINVLKPSQNEKKDHVEKS